MDERQVAMAFARVRMESESALRIMAALMGSGLSFDAAAGSAWAAAAMFVQAIPPETAEVLVEMELDTMEGEE